MSFKSFGRPVLQLLAAALAIVLMAFAASAQGTAGRILGTITDQSGGVIANATVTVTDVQRGIARSFTTDQSGEYSAPSLLPGTYSVRAEAKGFKTIEHSNLLLEVGKDIRVDLRSSPASKPRRSRSPESLRWWKPRTPRWAEP